MSELDRDIVVRAGRYEWLFRKGSEIVQKDGATYILPPKAKKSKDSSEKTAMEE